VALTLSSAGRLVTQYMLREGQSGYFCLIAAAAFTVSIWTWLLNPKDYAKAKVSIYLLLAITQVYLAMIGVMIYPDCTGFWGVASTIVFGLYEIQSFMSIWTVIAQLTKHLTMWYYVFSCSDSSRACGMPLGIILFGGVLVILTSRNTRNRAISYWRLYESIRKEKDNLAAILAAIPQGVIVITAEGVVSSCNPQALAMLNCRDACTLRHQLLSLHCISDCEELKPASLLEEVVAFLKEEQSGIETFGLTFNEDKQYHLWKGKRCTWNNSTACILTGSDMTSWRLMETKLRHENESKSAVLRYVAHELRTPANAILNLTSSVLSEARLTLEQQTQLKIVETSTHFLISVVNDLMDFTRMTAEQFKLVKVRFDFRREVNDAVELLRMQCVRKGLSLRANIDPMIPEIVNSDPGRIRQLLINLLSNSLKYTYNGDIRVTCVSTSANTIKITVSDTGLGLQYGNLAMFTQSFSTIEEGYNVNPQDCGLGLYVSNLLALSLGSLPLQHCSRAGGGSEISFEVDIDYSGKIEKREKHDREPSTSIGYERDTESEIFSLNITGGNSFNSHHFHHILVVDDVDFNRMVLLRLLGFIQREADEAASGLRALAKIRESARRGQYYSLIFMDVEMPEMDGIAATEQIRQMELTGELPIRARIVCCTAHSSREDIDRSLVAGMDDFLAKPVNRERLRSIVLGVRGTV
jgi:CheY-like chemotaxis protein/PAS domain-containing protein